MFIKLSDAYVCIECEIIFSYRHYKQCPICSHSESVVPMQRYFKSIKKDQSDFDQIFMNVSNFKL